MKRPSRFRARNYFDHPYTRRNSVEWMRSGRKYYEMLVELIDSSRFEIHLQTYIFTSDSTGNKVAEALIRAAERKVQIFILVDAYGSQSLNEETIKRFKLAGMNFRKYGEPYSKGRFHIGRRMHHKVIVIDGYKSVVGGINISDNYNDLPGSPAWLDFAVIMRGDISRRLLYVCRKRWIGWKFPPQSKKKLLEGFQGEEKVPGSSLIRVRRNDFVRNFYEISISYRETFRRAENSILLVGGYFLPGGRTRRIMRNAINRGVEINIMVSADSDIKVLSSARKYLYDWLIRNGIGVFEYTASNVHGKVLISDDKWISIGSFDLNNLSTYSNIELNVDIDDPAFSKSIAASIRLLMEKDCRKITKENTYRGRSVFSKFSMWLSYRFVKTLFMLSFLLAGKKEKEF